MPEVNAGGLIRRDLDGARRYRCATLFDIVNSFIAHRRHGAAKTSTPGSGEQHAPATSGSTSAT